MATEHYSTSKETLFALAHNALSIELLEDGYYCALRFFQKNRNKATTPILFFFVRWLVPVLRSVYVFNPYQMSCCI